MVIMTKKMSRRDFGLSMGAMALASPFLGLGSARGQNCANLAGPAKRVIFFYTPNGSHHPSWVPDLREQRPGDGYIQTDQFSVRQANPGGDYGSILQDLDAVQQHLLLLDGIDFKNGDNHSDGFSKMLTGGGNNNGGKSVDQHIAAELLRLGCPTRIPILNLGVNSDSSWGAQRQTRMSYLGAGEFATVDDNPVSVFNSLFANQGNAGGGVVADRAQLRKQSILDFAAGELSTLSRQVGRQQRVKLEQHLDGIRSLERQIGLVQEGASCERPAEPWANDPCGPGRGGCYTDEAFPAVGRAQMDLAVAAFGCDATRVVSMQWSHPTGQRVFNWLTDPSTGNPIQAPHHNLSHEVRGSALPAFVVASQWYSQQFRYLIDALAAQPDPVYEGSLFDNTLLLWMSEIGDGQNHTCESVPCVLATGSDGIGTGRYIDYASGASRDPIWQYQSSGIAHQKLLVSVCQAMGLDDQVFGTAEFGIGGLPGFLA
jgi:hypothetical protein